MKKIMFYINAIHHGGAERVICNLATRFAQQGYESILVTSFRDTWEYVYGDEVRRISLFEKQLKCNYLKRNFLLVKELRRQVKKENPDVLVSFMAEPNIRSLIATIGLKNKVIVSVRNDPDREYSSILTKFLAKRLFRRAEGVVFQTQDAKKWFPCVIQNKSKVIYNQVDELFYSTTYEGIRHDIVTTGRLTSQKNQELLIRAYSLIADKVEDNLIIYGTGELKEHLEKLISELNLETRVFLPGSTSNVAETIKNAKLFVLSSDYEGMPNSLMEAMALGIPCISTDCPCGGPKTLFGDVGESCLVPKGDCKKLSDKMMFFLSNEKVRKQIGEHMHSLAMQFKPEIVYEEWRNYILHVVDAQ